MRHAALVVLTGLALGCRSTTPSDPFSVSSIAPSTGLTTGTSLVSVYGTGFAAGTKVTFNGISTTVTVVSSKALSLTAPPHAPGAVDVAVTGPDGDSGTLVFTYVNPTPPSVTSVSPSAGSTLGGTPLAVHGLGFKPGVTVRLDGALVTAFLEPTGTVLYITAPAHNAGTVEVVVRNPDGLSATLPGGYTFAAPQSFDFNGNWYAFLNDGNDFPFYFTVAGNALVSLTCYEGTPVTLASPVLVSNGEMAASAGGIKIFSARILDADQATGTINAGACHSENWVGYRDLQGAAGRTATGRGRFGVFEWRR